MKLTAVDILKKYIEGKDEDKYQILEDIYSETAKVHFKINSENISFPNEVTGNLEIAKILSADFNQKYKSVKTYYLSKPDKNQLVINNQKWLVIMTERQTEKTRVGTGYYDWELTDSDDEFKVQNHKIFIHEMMELDDPSYEILKSLQNTLKYPWADSASVLKSFEPFSELDELGKYLN